MDDATAQLAKDKLAIAVREYFEVMEPDVYVDDWALVVHKDSISLTAEGHTMVSTVVPTGQAFHRTAGLLTLAQHSVVSY